MARPIQTFTKAQIEVLRLGFSTCREFGPEDEQKLDALFAECEDTALKQIANGGIRLVSLCAFVACWKRGFAVEAHEGKFV